MSLPDKSSSFADFILKFLGVRSEGEGPDLGRPIQLGAVAAMVKDQLGEGQVVQVRGYGIDAQGNYTNFKIAEPGAPSSLEPHDTLTVRSGPGNKGRLSQSCFAVPGGQGTRFTSVLPAQGFAAAGPPAAPATLKEMAAGPCDSGKISRAIREGTAVDDPGLIDKLRDKHINPAGSIVGGGGSIIA